jgi:hypothetical protein
MVLDVVEICSNLSDASLIFITDIWKVLFGGSGNGWNGRGPGQLSETWHVKQKSPEKDKL